MTWSIEDQKKLADMWLEDFSIKDIAAATNRSVDTVKHKAKSMGLVIQTRNKVGVAKRSSPPKIRRRCLKCRKEFMAEKQFFVCNICKASADWKSQGGSIF
jgi:hypothetical protein